MDNKLTALREAVRANPGGDEFVELALLLSSDSAARSEAREICFRGLTENPESAKGRLALARLFYLDGLAEFAVRELIELSRYSQPPSLEKLLVSFGPLAARYRTSVVMPPAQDAQTEEPEDANVVAEIDIDSDFMDALDELERQKD